MNGQESEKPRRKKKPHDKEKVEIEQRLDDVEERVNHVEDRLDDVEGEEGKTKNGN